MIRIGILGNIGSGKSYVANNFGYPVFNADNEVAKLHIKHMVGGRAPKTISARGEYIFRVQFPERPGALVDFLDNANST